MLFDISGSFSVLALVAGVISLVPPPPDNVTVSCQNFQTTVYWNYSKQHPQTSFKLIIGGSAGYKEIETDEHHYNLTSFVWESESRFSAFHSVKVSATEGKNESKMVESKTFSFNDLKTVDIDCYLDFPPVALSVNDLEAVVEFRNPHHYYETLKQANSTRAFVFTVHLLNDTDNHGQQVECSMNNKFCTYRFDIFPEMEKYCIKLDEGLMKADQYHVLFKKTDPICAKDSETVQDTSHIIIVAAVLSLFLIGGVVVAFMIVKTQAWKVIPSSLPKALEPIVSSIYGNVMPIPYESVSTASVTEPDFTKSYSSLSIVTAEETDRSETQTNGSWSDPSPKPIGSTTRVEGGLSESSNQRESKETMLTSETFESERCYEEDSVETSTLAPEEECSSAYDRPHRLEVEVEVEGDVDMGHGDVVKCYNR